MSVEAVRKEDVFARLQTRMASAGIGPLSNDMAAIQDLVQEFGRVAAADAVAAATLCVTEHDIARAVATWAEDATAEGQLSIAARLRRVETELLTVGRLCAEGRSRAMVTLPPDAEWLPPRQEETMAKILTLALPARVDHEPFKRIIRSFARYLAGQVRETGARPTMVQQPAQQQQAADARKEVMPHDSAQGEDVARPRHEGGSGGAAGGPQFETHNFDRPPTRGPDAVRPPYDRRTWDAAVRACSTRLCEAGHISLASILDDEVKCPE